MYNTESKQLDTVGMGQQPIQVRMGCWSCWALLQVAAVYSCVYWIYWSTGSSLYLYVSTGCPSLYRHMEGC